jgi:hypothetical protein
MMRQTIGFAMLTAVILTGCGRSEPTPPAVPQPSATPTAAEKAMPTTPQPAQEPTAAVAPAQSMEPAKTAADATADAKTATEDATAQATTLLEQVMQYIKDNKLDLAETALTKLDGMKGSLPTSLQEKITAAHTALQAKKASSMFAK